MLLRVSEWFCEDMNGTCLALGFVAGEEFSPINPLIFISWYGDHAPVDISQSSLDLLLL